MFNIPKDGIWTHPLLLLSFSVLFEHTLHFALVDVDIPSREKKSPSESLDLPWNFWPPLLPSK